MFNKLIYEFVNNLKLYLRILLWFVNKPPFHFLLTYKKYFEYFSLSNLFQGLLYSLLFTDSIFWLTIIIFEKIKHST